MKTSLWSNIYERIFPCRASATFLLGLAALLICADFLKAETTNYSGATQITALPATISTPGTYFIGQNFTVSVASGACINITCSGVTLDLDGHTITNSNGTTNTAYGVCATNLTNITILNGTISNFYYGIYLAASVVTPSSASYGHLIQNINFVKNTYIGLCLQGVGSRCYQCRSVLTGGGTTSAVYNIIMTGADNSVEDCDVCGQTGSATSYGLYFGGSNDNFAVNNRVSEVYYGLYQGGGAGVKYRDTLTSTVTVPYTGGSSAGNNN